MENIINFIMVEHKDLMILMATLSGFLAGAISLSICKKLQIFQGRPRSKEHQQAIEDLLSGWLEKVSVGVILVALFQWKHMLSGVIISVVCLMGSITLKTRRFK